MKRFLICFVALITVLCSCAIAEEGFYVLSYKSFMESFVNKVSEIDNEIAQAIKEECLIGGYWEESENRVISWYSKSGIILDFDKGNGFLESISIEISKEKLVKYEEVFKEIMLAAATSIIPDADDAFETTFFDNIYYEYAKASPAGYISIYWNCGVYLFNVTKSSSDITLDISLSVYEANK